MEVLECPHCNEENFNNLINEMNHEDNSIVRTYKCESCDKEYSCLFEATEYYEEN